MFAGHRAHLYDAKAGEKVQYIQLLHVIELNLHGRCILVAVSLPHARMQLRTPQEPYLVTRGQRVDMAKPEAQASMAGGSLCIVEADLPHRQSGVRCIGSSRPD